MKELLGSVDLLNRRTGQYEAAQLYRGTDQKNTDDFGVHWAPQLKDRRNEFQSWIEAANANAQDAHWDWTGKVEHAERSLRYETFAIECAGVTQGLMLVDVTNYSARLGDRRRRPLVYVELLATAPWNRPKFLANPVYKGVGRVLIATAINLSVELGYGGPVGLHSLPQSRTWYADELGFTDCGLDEAKKMHYFEMTEAQALTFISD